MQKSLHFLYHEVRPAASQYSYIMPLADFEAHCTLFARLRNGSEAEKLFCPEITFDDGHRSDLEYALPALERRGLHATFFITAGWTGERAGYMDWAAVRRLLSAGNRIGAHGLTHKLLTGCSRAELEEELKGARHRLEDNLGIPVRTMSLPGGRANQQVMASCAEAGFTQVFTSRPRAEVMHQQPGTVGRLNLLSGTTTDWLERVLDPQSRLLAKLERTQRLKAGAQQVLGDRVYARLWAMANRHGSEPVDGGQTS